MDSLDETSWGFFKIVRLLIELGADVNAQGRCGITPLHNAAGGGHLSLLNFS